jgi:Tol biopolymer transport system component
MFSKVLPALAALVAALAVPLAAGAAAPSGPAIVFASDRSGSRELYAVNADGTGLRRLTYDGNFKREPAWSPDRTKVAFVEADATGNWDIYSINADGSGLSRLTTDPARESGPRWTADGRIVFQHDDRAWIVGADGSNPSELPTGPGDAITPSASPKGDTIAFASSRGGATSAIYTMQLDGRGLRQVTFPSAGGDIQPRFSPNGNLISFMRDNGTNDNDLYVVHANGGKVTQLTATPDRLEYWSSWSGDDIVFSAVGANGWHIYSVNSSGGIERRVSTAPLAPFTVTFDTPLDSSLWHTISDPGGTVGVSGGELVASISGSAVPGGQYNQVDEHIGSQCSLDGDFDYQVDYGLLVWPDFGGFYAQLSAFFANGGVARASSQFSPPYNQQYWANTNDSAGSFTTTDRSGTFRLVRTNGTMSAYVKSPTNPDWRLVTSGSAPGSTVYGMGLWASADQFAHQDGSVAYDNFQLNSGALTCPTWWNDLAPDVG